MRYNANHGGKYGKNNNWCIAWPDVTNEEHEWTAADEPNESDRGWWPAVRIQ